MNAEPAQKPITEDNEAANEPSLASLENEIASLSATIQAATYQLICLIGEYDRRHGWADPLANDGFRSCAHWLSWRIGLALGPAREYVRVARALPALPLISAAFGRGELSYSKVRAVTRIATPDNEELLYDWALAGTASHVEKLVRKYRRSGRDEENERAQRQKEARGLSAYFDEDGMLELRGTFPPEQGALLLKALEVARDELIADERGRAQTSAPGPAAESEKERTAIEHVSAETSAVSRTVEKRNSRQLLADALVRLAEGSLENAAAKSRLRDRFQVVVHVDKEVLEDPDTAGRCELADGPVLAAETARRLACDGAVCQMQHGPQGELESGRKTRVISAPLRRALQARDGTRCAFPCCASRGREAHHVKSWAEGGPTTLENIINLCSYHHFLVHEGGYQIEPSQAGRFRFLRPDGSEIVTAPFETAAGADPAAALFKRWIPPEVKIDEETGRPTWWGEQADYEWAVLSLSHCQTTPLSTRAETIPPEAAPENMSTEFG